MLAADQDKMIEWINLCRDRFKMSYRDIARDLNKRNYRTKFGKLFEEKAVWRILNTEVHKKK